MINSKFYKLFCDEDACMNHFKALWGKAYGLSGVWPSSEIMASVQENRCFGYC